MSLVESVDARMAFHLRHKQARERMGCGERIPRVDDRLARVIEQKRRDAELAEKRNAARREYHRRMTRGVTLYQTPIGPLQPSDEPISIKEIQHAVACYYGITRADILSPSKVAKLIEPRRVAMVLSVKTGRGCSEVGRGFHRDHSCVSNAMERISACKDEAVLSRLRELANLLGIEAP